MQALIVEDDQYKQQKLLAFMADAFSEFKLLSVGSVTAATQVIESNDFDLIILDMSLPTYGVGREKPQGFGGRNLMRFLDGSDIKSPVIVFTQFVSLSDGETEIDIQELAVQFKAEFPDFFRGLIYFDEGATGAWREKLAFLIKEILASKSGAHK